MAAGHLVARLQAALDGKVYLDHLEHARGQFVALRQLLALLFEGKVKLMTLLLERFLGLFQHHGVRLVGQTNIKPLPAIQLGQVVLGQSRALGQLARAAVDGFADQELADTIEGVVFDDTQLIVQILAIAAQLVVDDGLSTFVAFDTFAREDLHVNDGAYHARGHAQRGVLDVGSLLAKDGAQQFLFWRKLGFALGRYLAHQHVVGTHFGADVDNARVVQTIKLGFGQVADVAGDFFGTQLGVARNHRQFLDMDRGVAVVGNDFFGDQDRVFEVVAIPGHERDQHVLTQSQFAQVGRCTIGQHVAAGDLIARLDDRALVDVGVLVGTGVLDEVVDIHTDFAGYVLVIVDTDHDALGVDMIDDAATYGLYRRARVDRNRALDTGTDQRLL